MGKYEICLEYSDDNSNGALIANCLNSIANELAEANRLKRWELLTKYPKIKWEQIDNNKFGEVHQYDKKDLGDQA